MERTFALLKGTSVVNCIVADDSFIELIKNDYTKIVETTGMEIKPGVGAVYDEELNTFGYPQVATYPGPEIIVEETPAEVTE